MPTKHPKEVKDEPLPEREAEERFNRLVGNLVKTPHKPHKEGASKPARGTTTSPTRD